MSVLGTLGIVAGGVALAVALTELTFVGVLLLARLVGADVTVRPALLPPGLFGR